MKADAEERQLAELRALREQAWALFREDKDALREDLEERGLGARVAHRVSEEAQQVWLHTLDVAAAHRGVVAMTVLALVAWFLRGPIARGIGSMIGSGDEPQDADQRDDAHRDDGEGERT
jgi:hypothetical protein